MRIGGDEGGVPEEEVRAIEFSRKQGLVLIEDDTWLSEANAISAVRAQEVALLPGRNEQVP